ncbi:MAG: hypothetical protein ACMUJJ_08095 [Roseicyclus sp.]|uniref:hypothetical protein n=1 Tax=Roseicyclus sp. TaxID=1914329 RepID=UPI003A8AD41D
MSGLGHNGGPTMEAGYGFRKLAWTKARAALLPSLPLEVVRLRVKRAERLGLPYRTYATIRATSGQDIVAFLFSGNALDLRRGETRLSAPVAARLGALDGAATRLAAIYAPTAPEAVLAAQPDLIEGAGRAPAFTAPWRETRDSLRALMAGHSLPADAVVLVAATGIERGWGSVAGFGGVLDRDVIFGTPGAA